MKRLALLVTALAFAAPAQAATSRACRSTQSIDELVAGPDGGARVGINHQLSSKPPLVGRASPDGTFRTSPAGGLGIWDSALGPDGRAWFNAGSAVVRVDAAGVGLPRRGTVRQRRRVRDRPRRHGVVHDPSRPRARRARRGDDGHAGQRRRLQ